MKITTLVAAASAAALTLGVAAAANAADGATGVTAELGLASAFNTSNDVDTTLIGVQGRVGYQFHKNFGVEVEAATGLGHDNAVLSNGSHVEVKEQYEVGAFAVGYLPVSEHADVLGRVGYATNRIKATAGGISATQTNDGAAAGVGLRFFPEAGNLGMRLDYTHYFFDHDAGANAISATVAYRF